MEQNMEYLYEYENGERVRNIGFMKIENQLDKSTIQLYAKSMDEVKGILFRRPNGEMYLGTWGAEASNMESPVMPEQRPATPQMPQQPAASQQPIAPQEPATIMEEVEEYIPPRNVTFEKIKRQDLSRLPRKEWRLANNSFLLHGFYNYHHLLYIEDEGQIWIGVPGIYHEKEKMAANSFGFTEFRRLMDVDINLNENERDTYEDFGYWCRQIPNS